MSKDDRFSNRPNVRQAEVPPVIETATLRDQFAMAALQMFGANGVEFYQRGAGDALVQMAYTIADYMMAARNT